MKKTRAKKSADILQLAAELIDETGKREVDIAELAKRAGLSRPSIHALFGRGEELSTKTAIYRSISDNVLESARIAIEVVLDSLPPTATPIERLVSLFRATLNTFRNNEAFGRVVLHQLNLKNDEENKDVFLIFAQVDQIIGDARARGQLDAERVAELKDYEIRHILFTMARGLLRAYYLQECFPISENGQPRRDQFGLGLKDIQVEVLRVLRVYCSEDLKGRIEAAIKAVEDEYAAMRPTAHIARTATKKAKKRKGK